MRLCCMKETRMMHNVLVVLTIGWWSSSDGGLHWGLFCDANVVAPV